MSQRQPVMFWYKNLASIKKSLVRLKEKNELLKVSQQHLQIPVDTVAQVSESKSSVATNVNFVHLNSLLIRSAKFYKGVENTNKSLF